MKVSATADEEAREGEVAQQLAADVGDVAVAGAEHREQLVGDEDEHRPDDAGDQQADAGRGVDALQRPFGLAGAEVLAGDRRRGAHQADRGPGDHREQLGVADGVGGLGGGAELQPADEAQQQHAGDVHGDALHAGGKPEPEQRSDHRPVGPGTLLAGEADDQPAAEQQPQRVAADRRRRDRRAHRRAGGAELGISSRFSTRFSTVMGDAQAQRRARVAGGPQRRRQHEEQQHADAERRS